MTSSAIESAVRHLHPTWIVYSAIRSLRALILPIVIMLFSGGGTLFQWFGIGAAVGISLFIIGVRALIWNRFTYEVLPQGIRVTSGLVSRQERHLPAERIQAIDLNENVLHRMLGVVAIQIESAAGAGGGADVILESVSRTEADRIRSVLLARRASEPMAVAEATAGQTTRVEDEGELLANVPYSRLIVAGATSGRIGPALGVVFAALQFADDILPGRAWQRIVELVPEPTVQVVAGVVLIGAILAWAFAILSTLLTFGNFQLRRVENRLQATYGLLERRRVSIPLGRIQAITVSEGLLRQPLRLAAIRAESAGYGKDSAESGVLMPIVTRREIRELLDRACPDYSVDLEAAELRRPPVRARRRYIIGSVRGTLIMAVIAIGVAIVIGPVDWQWGTLAIPLVTLAGIWGWLRYRDEGWLIEPAGVVVIRGRPLHRVTTITRVRRIQHSSLSQSPLQRRVGLASFHAAVASGGSGGAMGLTHFDRDEADRLLLLLVASNRGVTRTTA